MRVLFSPMRLWKPAGPVALQREVAMAVSGVIVTKVLPIGSFFKMN
jgi:hypothetical protein